MDIMIPNEKQCAVVQMVMRSRAQMMAATGREPSTVFISTDCDEVFEQGPFNNEMQIAGMESLVDYGLEGFSCYCRR